MEEKGIKLSHFRVFCYITYVHINDWGKIKFDAKSKKYNFIGYGEDEFGYQLLDGEIKRWLEVETLSLMQEWCTKIGITQPSMTHN